MATLDDMALERKLTIWDKGFDPSADTYGEYITRSGAVWSPAVPNDEPLRLECEHFLDCVRTGDRPRTDGAGRRPGGAGAGGAAGVPRRRRRTAGRREPVGSGAVGDVSARGELPPTSPPGCCWASGVEIGAGVELGGNVVIHAGTRIGDGCVIQDSAVIGKPPKLGSRSTASAEAPPPRIDRRGAAICAGAVVLAGAEIGAGAVVGDQAQVRERARIGPESVVGRGTAVDNDVTIGARVKVQSNCYVTAGTIVEDDVFVGPGRDADERQHDGPPPGGRGARMPRRFDAPAASGADR